MTTYPQKVEMPAIFHNLEAQRQYKLAYPDWSYVTPESRAATWQSFKAAYNKLNGIISFPIESRG